MSDKKSDVENPIEFSHDIYPSDPSGGKEDADIARDWAHEPKPKQGKDAALKNKLHNPLAAFSRDELFRDVEQFAHEKGLVDILPDLRKGAVIAQDPKIFESLEDLTEEDKNILRREKTHRWHQPFMMYFMTSMPPMRF